MEVGDFVLQEAAAVLLPPGEHEQEQSDPQRGQHCQPCQLCRYWVTTAMQAHQTPAGLTWSRRRTRSLLHAAR